jgi:hypothetical protein
VWYFGPKPPFASSQLTQFRQIPRQNAFLSHVLAAMFHHDCPLAVKPTHTPWRLLRKQTWMDSLPIDMIHSAVSILAVALPSAKFPEGLMNYSVFTVNTIRDTLMHSEQNANAGDHVKPPWGDPSNAEVKNA